MATATAVKNVDIRPTLPVAKKKGAPSNPEWVIEGLEGDFKFIKSLTRYGLDRGKKFQLGKRLIAKYVAGKTQKGDDLVFVGLFAAI